MQPLRKILGEFISDFGIENGAVLSAMRRQWSDVVGQTIAAHTFPDIIKSKILTIVVDTPQWMHHLSFYKADISKKLQPYKVNEIRFRLGRLPVKAEEKRKVKDPELSEEDLRFIENTLQHVTDEELKEKFEKLISHGLTRGKNNN